MRANAAREERGPFQERKWRRAMVDAAIAGDANSLTGLLRQARAHKANFHVFDADGLHPLFVASRGGHAECVKLLLPHWDPDSLQIERRQSRGLDADNKCVMTEDFWGMTPLAVAAEQGHAECVKVLLAESDPQIADGWGMTPLMTAVREGREEVVGILGPVSDINRVKSGGSTALMLAAINERESMVDALLAWGADPNLLDESEQSAMAMAMGRSESAKGVAEKLLRVTDLSAEDGDGHAALHHAVHASYFNDWVLPLFVRGMPADEFAAQMRKKDKRGLTPLGFACAQWPESSSGAEFLLEHCAQRLSQEELDDTIDTLMRKSEALPSIDALAFVVSDAKAQEAWRHAEERVLGKPSQGDAYEMWNDPNAALLAECPKLRLRMENLALKDTVNAARSAGASPEREKKGLTAEEKAPVLRRPRVL